MSRTTIDFGIDLGTTNSAVAVFTGNHGEPTKVIKNTTGLTRCFVILGGPFALFLSSIVCLGFSHAGHGLRAGQIVVFQPFANGCSGAVGNQKLPRHFACRLHDLLWHDAKRHEGVNQQQAGENRNRRFVRVETIHTRPLQRLQRL